MAKPLIVAIGVLALVATAAGCGTNHILNRTSGPTTTTRPTVSTPAQATPTVTTTVPTTSAPSTPTVTTTVPTTAAPTTTVPVISAETLGGVRLGVPSGWTQPSAPVDGGDHTDYLFVSSDNPNEQLLITSDLCTGCVNDATPASLSPTGATVTDNISATESGFAASGNARSLSSYWTPNQGPGALPARYATDGVVVFGAPGGAPAYAIVAVTLPVSQHALATRVLNSVLIVPAPAAPVEPASVPSVDATPGDTFSLQVRPAMLELSGDATNIVYGLTWPGWDEHGATGNGTVNVLGCNPDCADGTSTPTPVRIYLNDPVNGVFSLLTENIEGQPSQNITLPTTADGIYQP